MPRRSAADSAAALRQGKQGVETKAERAAGVRRTTLPGGLRVVTEYLPAVRSASVGVWVGVGSRDEGATVAGAAHFLEHLLFKSTPTRTAVDIAQAMDAVGGELNAFTAKEHTCYYAHVLDSDLALAVDLVADVVLNGRCAADDVELERRRRPRGDRDARRRPRGRAGGHVHDGAVRRPPGGPPGDRQRGIGVVDDAGPVALVSRAALHPGADGRRGGRQRRPRRGGRVGARALRVAVGPRSASPSRRARERAGSTATPA